MIRFTDTYVAYRSGTRALRGVNMEIGDGEFVFIVGASGAGKSTLLRLFTAELRPKSGTAVVNGFSIGKIKRRQIPALRRTVGVVYQDFKLIDRMTVFDNVAFAMHIVGVHDKKVIRERVEYVLRLVGIEDKVGSLPGELSGGEQQRAVIARALVNNPSIIVADEPTGNLDPARSYEIMELLIRIHELGSTVIVITHEKELVDQFSQRVILLEDGRVAGDRAGGYVSSMVSDGSELAKNAAMADLEAHFGGGKVFWSAASVPEELRAPAPAPAAEQSEASPEEAAGEAVEEPAEETAEETAGEAAEKPAGEAAEETAGEIPEESAEKVSEENAEEIGTEPSEKSGEERSGEIPAGAGEEAGGETWMRAILDEASPAEGPEADPESESRFAAIVSGDGEEDGAE